MRDTFVRTLTALARENRQIELVTGDLGFGVLQPYWEQCPDQFTNAGIAEQNMTALAAGMAMEGKIVFTYSIGTFPTLRCLEQIRNDCAYHHANVKIVCVGGGFVYGSLGMSHHATEDIACMRALPDVTVMAPADAAQARSCVRALAAMNGTAYLRLGRGGEKSVPCITDCGADSPGQDLPGFRIGRALKAREGERVVIFSTGAIFDEVSGACDRLEKAGYDPAVYTFPTVKPLDEELICRCAEEYELIVTVEEHTVIGGFGSAVAEVMAGMSQRKARLLRIGVSDCYCEIVGTQSYLREQYGMSADRIAERIMKACP